MSSLQWAGKLFGLKYINVLWTVPSRVAAAGCMVADVTARHSCYRREGSGLPVGRAFQPFRASQLIIHGGKT